MPEHPHVVVGSGYVAFESEQLVRSAIESSGASTEVGRLFNEVQDDRYVLETALAGNADILATSDLADFGKGRAILLDRDDVVLFPFSGRTIVIAKPSFVAYWLRQGIVPDASFAADNPDDFRTRQSPIRPSGAQPGFNPTGWKIGPRRNNPRHHPGDNTWITRLAIMSFVFAP